MKRVRIVPRQERAPWDRMRNRRGGLYTLWSAWEICEGRWLLRDYSTRRAVKKELRRLGYADAEIALGGVAS